MTRKPGDQPDGTVHARGFREPDGVFRCAVKAKVSAAFPVTRRSLTRSREVIAMKRILATATAMLAATPAFAHHPLNGMPMETFGHGILSGIGHPVLGFDHLFFVALVGIAALYTGRALTAPLYYVAAMLFGCIVAMAGAGLPLAELAIIGSLLVLGYVVAAGRSLTTASAALIFGGFGLFHGTAFAGSILGQEGGASMAVMVGYLIGLGLVQYVIAVLAGRGLKAAGDAAEASAIAPRLAGATVAGVGLFLALEAVEGPALSALGL